MDGRGYKLPVVVTRNEEIIKELVEALRPFAEYNNKPKMYAIDLRVFDLAIPIKIADALVKKYEVK